MNDISGIDFAALAAPFTAEQISWRVGPTTQDKKSGIGLAYIDSRDVQMRLDNVCNPMRWQSRFPHAGQKTVCEIGIFCGANLGWVFKSDGSGDTDMEEEKGALSGAFKRAGVMWGIGRYLYDMPNIWVPIMPRGKSFVITPEGTKTLIEALKRHMAGLSSPSGIPETSAPIRRATGNMATEAERDGLTDTTRAKGTLATAAKPTPAETRAAKIKAAVDKRIDALKSQSTWLRTELDDFWRDDKKWIDWMADPNNAALLEYERFTNAFADAELKIVPVELA